MQAVSAEAGEEGGGMATNEERKMKLLGALDRLPAVVEPLPQTIEELGSEVRGLETNLVDQVLKTMGEAEGRIVSRLRWLIGGFAIGGLLFGFVLGFVVARAL